MKKTYLASLALLATLTACENNQNIYVPPEYFSDSTKVLTIDKQKTLLKEISRERKYECLERVLDKNINGFDVGTPELEKALKANGHYIEVENNTSTKEKIAAYSTAVIVAGTAGVLGGAYLTVGVGVGAFYILAIAMALSDGKALSGGKRKSLF